MKYGFPNSSLLMINIKKYRKKPCYFGQRKKNKWTSTSHIQPASQSMYRKISDGEWTILQQTSHHKPPRKQRGCLSGVIPLLHPCDLHCLNPRGPEYCCFCPASWCSSISTQVMQLHIIHSISQSKSHWAQGEVESYGPWFWLALP